MTFRVMGGKSGKIRHGCGKVGGKNGAVWRRCGHIHANEHVVANGCGWRYVGRYAVGKVREPGVGSLLIELIYYELE